MTNSTLIQKLALVLQILGWEHNTATWKQNRTPLLENKILLLASTRQHQISFKMAKKAIHNNSCQIYVLSFANAKSKQGAKQEWERDKEKIGRRKVPAVLLLLPSLILLSLATIGLHLLQFCRRGCKVMSYKNLDLQLIAEQILHSRL